MTRYMRSAAVAVAALFLVTTAASAAPILQVTGGILTGATGVDVGGTLYDVELLDGSCVSVFSGCDDVSDFAFQTEAEANAAGTACSRRCSWTGRSETSIPLQRSLRGVHRPSFAARGYCMNFLAVL